MGRPVDGRAAAVDPDVARARAGSSGRVSPDSVSCRLRVIARPSTGRRDDRLAAWQIPRPAPSMPARLPVDALTSTASGAEAERRRDRVAHRVEVAGEPRPRADDRQVDRSGTSPAAADPLDHGRQERRAGDAPRRGGVGREEPAEVAEPGRAEQRVGHGVQGDVAVGVTVESRAPSIATPPSASGSPGPNGWLSLPRPTRSAPVRRGEPVPSATLARARSAGTVTLRFVGSPGIAWTAILAASSRAASSVKLGRAVRRERAQAARSDAGPDPLRRLGRRERGPIDGLRRRARPRSA